MKKSQYDINYSFIIPHKNTPDLLQRCLDSIPQRRDIEVIVVDNNSSTEIVDFYHFPGCKRADVSIIKDNVSVGAGGARNTGLKKARGKWVLFADADDYYCEEFLMVLDQYIDSDYDVIYFNFIIKKGYVTVDLPRRWDFLKNYTNSPQPDALKYQITVPWNKMMRRYTLLERTIKFEDCLVGNDIFFSYQVGYFIKSFAFEKSKLYCYINNKLSTTHRKNNTREYYCCIFRHVFQCNEFRKFIHRQEWNRSLLNKFLAILIKKGFLQFCYSFIVWVWNYRSIISQKYGFVEQLKSTNERS